MRGYNSPQRLQVSRQLSMAQGLYTALVHESAWKSLQLVSASAQGGGLVLIEPDDRKTLISVHPRSLTSVSVPRSLTSEFDPTWLTPAICPKSLTSQHSVLKLTSDFKL